MITRIIQTKIYRDSWFSELSPIEKLVFIYFLTNEYVNLIWLYECPDKRIIYELGITQSQLNICKEKFSQSGKIAFFEGWVFLVNAHKYETYAGDKNESAKQKMLSTISKSILDWYESILDRGIDRGIDRGMYTPSIPPIIHNTEIINKIGGVGGKIKKVEKTSRNSLTPCTFEEIGEIAKEMQLNVKDVKTTHDTIMDKIAADEFKYKTVYFTLRTWLRLSIQKGHIKQYSGPVFQKDPRLLEIEQGL